MKRILSGSDPFSSGPSILSRLAMAGLILCTAAVALTLASGCSKGAGLAEGNLFQLPWPDETGSYHLQKVSVMTYDQPHSLQGRFVNLFVDPYVKDGRLDGATPNGRYIRNSDGVYIPSDFISLQAAAIHAHYERLSAMTESSGVHLQWPVKIGVQSNVIDKTGSVHNNAIFDSQLDALLIVPYVDPSLPIAVNGGILAHEHFHMIFQSLVLSHIDADKDPVTGKPGASAGMLSGPCNVIAPKPGKLASDHTPLPTDSGRDANHDVTPPIDGGTGPVRDAVQVYNSFFLRAMNEGLADFWAWVYTGDTAFIEKSLPAETRRRLDSKVGQLRGLGQLKMLTVNFSGELLDDEHLVGNAYTIGTDYAKLMVEVATQVSGGDAKSFEARMAGARLLIQSLPTIAEAALNAKKAREFLSPNIFLKGLSLNLPSEASTKACEVVNRAAAFEIKSPLQGVKCAGLESAAANRLLWDNSGSVKK